MKVTNPLKEEISMQFEGIVYTIAGESSKSNVPAEAAEHWKTMVHNFVTLSPDDTVVETKVEVKEEGEVKEEKETSEKKSSKKVTK